MVIFIMKIKFLYWVPRICWNEHSKKSINQIILYTLHILRLNHFIEVEMLHGREPNLTKNKMKNY